MENDPLLIIPETIFKALITNCLNSIDHDIRTMSKRDSYLYKLFSELGDGNFKYYDQAKAIFTKSNGNSRQLKVKLGYDGDMSAFPVAYITSGKDVHKFMPIGGKMSDDIIKVKGNRQYSINSCTFSAESSVVVMTDSIEELLVIYHVLRAVVISAHDTFTLSGLYNLKLGGADVALEDHLIPKGVFMRMLSLSYDYDINVPSLTYKSGQVSDFNVTGKPINTYNNEQEIR